MLPQSSYVLYSGFLSHGFVLVRGFFLGLRLGVFHKYHPRAKAPLINTTTLANTWLPILLIDQADHRPTGTPLFLFHLASPEAHDRQSAGEVRLSFIHIVQDSDRIRSAP